MWIPFALSLDKYVNKTGTDVGFGCLLAVALLSVLYFAGARETRSLRHQLEDAQNRIAALEARVAQALRSQAAARAQAPQSAVPGRPGVVPAPRVAAAASPVGSAVARVRREVLAGAVTSGVTGVLLGAPAGAGAPSLGSATKLIPGPEAPPVPAPTIGLPAAVPAAATAAGAGSAPVPLAAGAGVGPATEVYDGPDEDDYEDEFEPDDTMYVPAGASAAANGRSGGPAIVPPPAGFYDDDHDPVGPPPRRSVPLIDEGDSGSRTLRRALGGLVALLVIAAVVVVLLVVTNNGSSNSKTTTAARSVVKKAKRTKVVFDPAKVKVSVLNGTGMTGLAGDVATLVKQSGYTVPHAAITNADVQTVTTTTVGYRPGFRDDAFRVAKSLSKTSGVAVTDVVVASSTSITSCATPTATGQTGTCPASVIVTVGTDLESAASGSTTGA